MLLSACRCLLNQSGCLNYIRSPPLAPQVEKHGGIGKLAQLLAHGQAPDEVRAEAAEALAVLATSHERNQDQVASVNGLPLLIALLQGKCAEAAKEGAASALWALAASTGSQASHKDNQVAIAAAGGIAPLVAALGLGARAQEQAAGALASLGLNNLENEIAIAKLVVELLGHESKQQAAKAARAISRLAVAHASNQHSLASAGGVARLVGLLDTTEGGVGVGVLTESQAERALESARVQKEVASAIWAMTRDNPDNQIAIAAAGGIPPLIALLEGHPEVHRDVAGALWSLAANSDNQQSIAAEGGIAPLVQLISKGSIGAQETAAGALYALAETAENRVLTASVGGIPLLVALFETGSEMAKDQASGALQRLSSQNPDNQSAIAAEAVEVLTNGSAKAQEYVTTLIKVRARSLSPLLTCPTSAFFIISTCLILTSLLRPANERNSLGVRFARLAEPGHGPREPLCHRQGGRGTASGAPARDRQHEGDGDGGERAGAHRAQIGRVQ